MRVPVLQSRLSPPEIGGYTIDRTHLLTNLPVGPQTRLVLVSAPAGYGKTTLVCQWAKRRSGPVAWIAADGIHRDPRTFTLYLLAALARHYPQFDQSFWQIPVLQVQWDPEYILGNVINTLDEQNLPCTLVIDDYHVVDRDEINALTTYLLRNLPSTVTVVIATRSDPHIPLASMRAKRELVEIGAHGLRFELGETIALLGGADTSGIADDEIGVIHNRTEGWVTGIHLSALARRTEIADTSRYARDFFMEEILQHEDEEVRSFLTCTSVVPYLNASLCDALLPERRRSSQEILSELVERNVFIRAVSGQEGWFVLHPLLRESVAQERSGDDNQLHSRAGRWFWGRRQYGECFAHLAKAQEYETMALYLSQCWDSMDQTFQSRLWLDWAEPLHESVINGDPWLANRVAWALLQSGRLLESEELLDRQESQISGGRNDKPLLFQIHSARSHLAFAREDLDDAILHARRMEELAEPGDAYHTGLARSFIALWHWNTGHLERACDEFSRFVQAMRTSATPVFALAGYNALAQIRLRQGRGVEAGNLLTEALALENGPHDVIAKFKAILHLRFAVLEFLLGDREAMEVHLEESARQARDGSLTEYHYQFHQFKALVHESDGRWERALSELERAEHLFVRTPIVDDISITRHRARIWIRMGRKTTIHKHVGRLAREPSPEAACQYEPAFTVKVRYCLAFFRDSSELVAHLEPLNAFLDLATTQGRLQNVIELLCLKARVLHYLDRKHEALVAITSAVGHVDATGLVQMIILEREHLEPLFAKFKDEMDSIEATGRIHSVLREHRNRMTVLTARELEILRLMADGLSNRRIGERLFIAETTVKGHNQKIFQKLNVAGRFEAIAAGRSAGLVE